MYRKRLVALTFAIISIVSAILAAICIGTGDRNCTEEFTLYKELRDITDKEDLISYLTERNISYTIKNNVLELKDFELISLTLSDSSCSVKKNPELMALEKLDTENEKDVKYEKIFDSGKTITKRSYNDVGYGIVVELIGENYYIQHYYAYITWLVLSIALFIMCVVGYNK